MTTPLPPTRMPIHPASFLDSARACLAIDASELRRKFGDGAEPQLRSIEQVCETLLTVIRDEWPEWAEKFLEEPK